jgi:hypothetical protein
MEVFDPLRKKNVALTPEENVRQHFIKWLQEKRGWPLSLMISETEIKIGSVKFRCDIVCYNKQLEPQMIVECKAPDVKITEKTFEQIWKYALILKVKWLAITNGVATFACEYNNEAGKYLFIKDVPQYIAQ